MLSCYSQKYAVCCCHSGRCAYLRPSSIPPTTNIKAPEELPRGAGLPNSYIHRHVWLGLTALQKKDKEDLLGAPLLPDGLFGASITLATQRFQRLEEGRLSCGIICRWRLLPPSRRLPPRTQGNGVRRRPRGVDGVMWLPLPLHPPLASRRRPRRSPPRHRLAPTATLLLCHRPREDPGAPPQCSWMVFSCFSSSDPISSNVTQLYDASTDEGELWMRDGLQPLPPCPSTSPPPPSRCVPCADRIVHAVCRNLTDGVNLVMEAAGHDIKITKSECPKLLDPIGPAGPPGNQDALNWWLLILIIGIIIIIIIIFMVCHKIKKCYKTPEDQRRSEDGPPAETMLEEFPV
ncbi:uncharacterized protein LOC144539594 isoform X2 [Centroberyx gerrardi]